MDINTYKNTLLSKIEDCKAKSQYYKSFTDTVTAARWQGKGEVYEEVLNTIDKLTIEEQKEIKSNGRKGKT
jgi:hypothetical protein